MCDYPRPSEKVERLRQYHQSQGSPVQQTPSPRDTYETELKDEYAKFREASYTFTRDGSILMGGSDLVDFHPNCDTLLLAAERIKQLKVRGTTVRQEENDYQNRIEQEQADGLRAHLNILGTTLCKRVFTEWLAAQQSSPAPVEGQPENEGQSADTTTDLEFSPIADLPTSGDPSAGDQVKEEVQPAESAMTLDYVPVVSDLQQPTPAALSTPNIPPVSDTTCNPGNYTNENQQSTMWSHTRNPQMTPRSKSSKMKRRARRQIPSGPLTHRTIEFSEVYQNGHARQKYVIDKCGDYWYIVKCEEHQLEFRTAKPLLGAIKHLRAQEHNPDGTETSIQMAIAKFGRRVIPCSDEDAEKNNKVAIGVFSYDEVGVPQRRKRTRADVLDDTDDDMPPNTRNNSRTSVSPIKPQPGEVYKIFWGNHGCFYAAVILPRTGSLSQAGFEETNISIKDTPLVKDLRDIPRCYEYDPTSGVLEWAESFGPGGPKASQSKYPAMYLTDPEFEDCKYCWLHVSKLQTYRRNDRNVMFQESVNNFITGRDQAANGDYIAEPTAVLSGTETTDDRSPISHSSSTTAEQSGFSRESTVLLSDNDSEFERRLVLQTRENSRMKEEAVQQSPMEVAGVPLDKSEVQAPEQPAMMDQEKRNGQAIDHSPVLEQHDGHMDVDAQVDNAIDFMITPGEKITKEEIQMRNVLRFLKHDVHNDIDHRSRFVL
ncbi:hypothetical protein FPSE5266_05540 [Fusarium pseudograminearum]|nr:hypothetical protein FPSE5266_05540 [Fusarium pseudograminearum]